MGKWDGSISADLPVNGNCPPIVVTPLEQPCLDTADRAADDDASSVFAITHLPRSEYVSDGSPASPALENRTALLTFDEAGFARYSLFGSALAG
jgi:hypothetical protein